MCVEIFDVPAVVVVHGLVHHAQGAIHRGISKLVKFIAARIQPRLKLGELLRRDVTDEPVPLGVFFPYANIAQLRMAVVSTILIKIDCVASTLTLSHVILLVVR